MRKRRIRLVLLGPMLVAAAIASACGDEPSGPSPLGNRTPRDGGTTTDLMLEASTADRGAGELAHRGTLATTATVPFGGPYMDIGYCRYSVTLKDIEIDLVVADGQLVASSVRDQMVEGFIGTCNSNQPLIATNLHTYALSTAVTSTSGGFRAEYLYSSGNQPKASLVVDLVKEGTGYTANATWHRNDIGKPFDWTVTASIPITQQ